jgi:LysM repeat protein
MNKLKIVVYASIGSLISVLIWGLIGGCQTPSSTSPGEVEMKAPEPVSETEEELVEEGILTEEAEFPPASETLPEESGDASIEEGAEVASYTVEKGDTLWSISRSYGISVRQLQEANKIVDPNRISVGQELIIPR